MLYKLAADNIQTQNNNNQNKGLIPTIQNYAGKGAAAGLGLGAIGSYLKSGGEANRGMRTFIGAAKAAHYGIGAGILYGVGKYMLSNKNKNKNKNNIQ